LLEVIGDGNPREMTKNRFRSVTEPGLQGCSLLFNVLINDLFQSIELMFPIDLLHLQVCLFAI
jgi:hypothetical protein